MEATDLYGIPELDDEHRAIDAGIMALSGALSSGKPWEETHPLLVHLHDIIRIHFAVEEAVMQIMSYPHTFEHMASHKGVLRDLEELKQISLENRKLEGLGDSLETTFARGVFKHDKVLIEFIKAHREALIPAA